MERSGSTTLVNDRRPSAKHNDIALRTDDAATASFATRPQKSPSGTPRATEDDSTAGLSTSNDYDRRRTGGEDPSRLTNMSSTLISKTVTPFLREHIPNLYAPIWKPDNEESSKAKNPNSRYCYRHRPDLKCRRAADENKMIQIQSVSWRRLPTPTYFLPWWRMM